MWMSIGDHFREEKLLPKAIIIGDMTVRRNRILTMQRYIAGQRVSMKKDSSFWACLVTQNTKCVIFHFGTNNIPKYHYSDPEILG